VLGSLLPLLQTVEEPAQSFAREAVLAALNGVLGDRLHDSNNPLASCMGPFRVQDQVSVPWNASAIAAGVQSAQAPPSGKILVPIHGLCMNELQWTPSGQTGHADALAAQLGYTPIYVRYNTGLHISQNGQALSELLEQLVRQWPVPVEEITLLTHSMGGLVARSAVEFAKPRWRAALKNMIFLGTPHQGAPLEKAGNWIDVILGSTPYSRPFAKLGQLRSAGITDLRYGHVVQADGRHVVPLPEGVACYAVAATLAPKRSPLSERVLGDGLVPLPSALGQHHETARQLKFAKDSVFVAYRTHHMQLLHSREVTTKLLQWLAPPTASGD
jgi:pimeloyl-ACP methyl ester carboxylesterase